MNNIAINIKIEALESLLQDMRDKKREIEMAITSTRRGLDKVLNGVGLVVTELQFEAIFNFVVEEMGEGC